VGGLPAYVVGSVKTTPNKAFNLRMSATSPGPRRRTVKQGAGIWVRSVSHSQSYYVTIQLVMFRDKLRVIEIMNEVMRSATDEEVRALASFISRLPPPKGIIDVPNTTRIERAKSLVSVYRCDFCHRPDFAGDLNVPRFAGQREDYLIKALRGYKDNSPSGYDASMADVMAPITDEQILDVAYYLARVR
jgi:cytochrome c553